ncbi:succinylglutamate desuccinylase/aspartoacylase family protein [Oceanibacterium hippocampi]|uniref:Succinylglutamate desuccinylase / Aspartoacylase family protein n=1 Tax=Oceanibacterium hippocampi TaxID=745714 RepID=A0A1Y5TIG6_9PROT|nr:succinylglutamate desuccinylase/aspartoacylase family protein [Oceanibacterium hippocampi]SLN64729.1 Succinylglutamate desuccinylase / Aspartoacylase family protein [Oceanibacterium hippocampi]
MDEIRLGSAVSTAPGIATGKLKFADYPDGRPMETPVVIVRGAKPGKTLWVHGCVHGNEYCGTFIILKALRALDPAAMSGTVIALPALNITAFHRDQRMSPFEGYGGGDMNRCFPGDPNGSLTMQMAHHVYSNLKKHADVFLDFHTAMTSDVRWALYADMGGKVSETGRGVALAWGFHSTLATPPHLLAGSAMMTAAKDGIPGFIVESGGKGFSFTKEGVADGAERFANVMRHLGMLEGKVVDYGGIADFADFAWVTAPRGGLFIRAVNCGDALEVGTVLGHFYNIYGEPDGVAESPHKGTVLAIHPGPIMNNGATLVHIGLNPRES